MFDRLWMRAASRAVFCALASLAPAMPANSEIIYSYSDKWLYDSSSGLYWQVSSIPTTTYVPEFGMVATYSQYMSLFEQIGVVGEYYSGAYSQPIANLVSFFQNGLPAEVDSEPVPDWQYLGSSAILNYPVAGQPANPYEFSGFIYSHDDISMGSAWELYFSATVGSFGPTRPCEEIIFGGTCPETYPAYIVSTVPPSVPLPAAFWLFASGLASFGAISRSRRS